MRKRLRIKNYRFDRNVTELSASQTAESLPEARKNRRSPRKKAIFVVFTVKSDTKLVPTFQFS